MKVEPAVEAVNGDAVEIQVEQRICVRDTEVPPDLGLKPPQIDGACRR